MSSHLFNAYLQSERDRQRGRVQQHAPGQCCSRPQTIMQLFEHRLFIPSSPACAVANCSLEGHLRANLYVDPPFTQKIAHVRPWHAINIFCENMQRIKLESGAHFLPDNTGQPLHICKSWEVTFRNTLLYIDGLQLHVRGNNFQVQLAVGLINSLFNTQPSRPTLTPVAPMPRHDQVGECTLCIFHKRFAPSSQRHQLPARQQ
jgi:hypothetical protein